MTPQELNAIAARCRDYQHARATGADADDLAHALAATVPALVAEVFQATEEIGATVDLFAQLARNVTAAAAAGRRVRSDIPDRWVTNPHGDPTSAHAWRINGRQDGARDAR